MAKSPKNTAVSRYLASIGRKGGSTTSDAKAAAARENGKKGGRPRKSDEAIRRIGVRRQLKADGICTKCKGEGRVWGGHVKCSKCNGSGKVLQAEPHTYIGPASKALPVVTKPTPAPAPVAGTPRTITYEGRIPKTLRAYVEKHCVGKVYDVDHGGGFATESGNAYDVGIEPGWCLGDAYDRMHTIIEPTVRDVIDRLKTLRRCECDAECKQAWAAREGVR